MPCLARLSALTVCLWALAVLSPAVAHAGDTYASREYSLSAGLSDPTGFAMAASREVSLSVELGGSYSVTTVVSRESSVFAPAPATLFGDAASRECSVYIDPFPSLAHDASSREVAVFVSAGPYLPKDAVSRESSFDGVLCPGIWDPCFYSSSWPACCTIPISSSLAAYSFPVTGDPVSQYATLNGGPPPFNLGTWALVQRHSDMQIRSAFVCGTAVGVVGFEARMTPQDPPSGQSLADPDGWTDSNGIRIFREQAGPVLGAPLAVDYLVPLPGSNELLLNSESGLVAGNLPAGLSVDSYLVHWDIPGTTTTHWSGSITFDSPVLGVILKTVSLDASDALLGRANLSYPNAGSHGLELDDVAEYDQMTISSDRKTVVLDGHVGASMDEVRILVATGELNAISRPFVDSSEFLLGTDEVTRDNCSSAFYRWTFDLPVDGYRWAVLKGRINADDIGVAFLNGSRITPILLTSDQFGVDRRAQDPSIWLLSAPTPDSIYVCDPNFFRPGTNELIIGIHGGTNSRQFGTPT